MRISKLEMFMRLAEVAKQRSVCQRLQVGCVVADMKLTQVLGFGYNGPEAGGPNECPGGEGVCGCLHAEVNAIIKAEPGEKLLFTTTSPCMQCAKLCVNAGVVRVYFREQYRDLAPLNLLHNRGVEGIWFGPGS